MGVVGTQFHSVVEPSRETAPADTGGDGRNRVSQRGTEPAEFTCNCI